MLLLSKNRKAKLTLEFLIHQANIHLIPHFVSPQALKIETSQQNWVTKLGEIYPLLKLDNLKFVYFFARHEPNFSRFRISILCYTWNQVRKLSKSFEMPTRHYHIKWWNEAAHFFNKKLFYFAISFHFCNKEFSSH